MRLSAYLPTWTHGLSWGLDPRWPDMVERARRLEAIGLDGIWVADQMQQVFVW